MDEVIPLSPVPVPPIGRGLRCVECVEEGLGIFVGREEGDKRRLYLPFPIPSPFSNPISLFQSHLPFL